MQDGLRGVHGTGELLRRVESVAFWRGLSPLLHVEGEAGPAGPEPDDGRERAWLEREGLVELPGAAPLEVARAITDVVASLVAGGLPGTFVYVYDEVWAIGERLRARLERLVSTPLVLVEDFWAFHVLPGSRGWPPHRGNPRQLLDRAAPEHLNAWIAMTDVPAERGALAFVPLEDDPGYPSDLGRVDAPLAAVRALPVSAGTALAWNGNVLHWGGPCAARAAGPRVSVTFTYARPDAVRAMGMAPLEGIPRSVAARRQAIAGQIALYGGGQPDVSPDVLAWARADAILADRLRKDR